VLIGAVAAGLQQLRSQPALAETTAATTISYVPPSSAQVTQRIFMNVRISRSDGTFYVRDDLPDVPENRVYNFKLVLGLFGKNAPRHVEKFLSYISGDSPLDDNPLPSYGRSYFTSFDEASGLLLGGSIPSLELTEVGGGTAIRYGGRLLPASLWVERPLTQQPDSLPPRISHAAKGLLTHRNLDATPAFGVTTRTDTTQLDRSHTVFGAILFGESTDAATFMDIVPDLPTYSVDRPASMRNGDPGTGQASAVDDATEAVFNAQRDFFRQAAKTFGDSRVDKVYEGKLLRRVQVTQVGLL